MSSVGFIGLGTMGAPMAHQLLKAGHELTFFARREEVAAEFTAAGARRAASPASVARAAEFIITIVTADAQVRDVALGENGVIAGAAPHKLLLEMSTIGPDTARDVGHQLRHAGMRMLDAPVSGGPWGAKAATLSIMVGGERSDFERAEPILQAMGDKIFYLGPQGTGSTAKLVNQMMGGAIMTLIGEGFSLARAAGIDLNQLADVISVSSANSSLFEARGKKFILENKYIPGFTTELMRKDVGLALELGRQLNVPLPVAAAAYQLYTAAVAAGLAAEDFAAVAKIAAKNAGVTLT
ncbi:MAG: NAD(P)-dependent oxidoreductase [Pirellulales bacterium]|nr:NAD(P)-dependent oxidoreductase [Pirellulales bacterium]